MSLYDRPRRSVPTLNTSSLPDLVFTVLFFFMIVTHFRKTDVKVKYREPVGTELTRLANHSAVSYIYIGTPMNAKSAAKIIQAGDRYATPADIMAFVERERSQMSESERSQMIVTIKADRSTPMSMINEVKRSLRKAGALTITYSAENAREEQPKKRR